MSGYVTLRDIVKSTGLSIATVSRALRDLPGISAATRTMVQQAARELGYRVDPVLAALSAHRWHRRQVAAGSTLAALADGSLEGRKGMAERAAAYGYNFEVFQLRDYPDARRLGEVLYARGILGLIVGQIRTPGFCAAFDWSRFTAVAVSEGAFRPPIHLVMPNHFQAVQSAWDQAVRMGCRRIGMVIFDEPEALDFHDRRAALFERQAAIPTDRRLPVLALPINLAGEDQDAEYRRRIGAWMQRHRPDVVLGFNDWIIGAIRAVGVRVPEDVAFLSLWSSEANPDVAGMLLSPNEVGRRAVDWVDLLLRAGERGVPEHPATMEIEFVWPDGTVPLRPSSPLRNKAIARERGGDGAPPSKKQAISPTAEGRVATRVVQSQTNFASPGLKRSGRDNTSRLTPRPKGPKGFPLHPFASFASFVNPSLPSCPIHLRPY